MTSWVVADSGIFIAAVLPEPLSAKSQLLIRLWTEQLMNIAAPVLIRYEIVAAIRKSVYRSLVEPDEAVVYLDALQSLPITLHMDNLLFRRAYEFATQLNLPTAYDSQYLAVAERLECDFWTLDERLFNAVKDQLAWVKWVGNVKTEAPA